MSGEFQASEMVILYFRAHAGIVILYLIDFRLRGERVCLPQACLSFASPKESHQRKGDPGIARKPERKFACQGAVITRLALPSRASDICRLKTLANDFLPARFTGTPTTKSRGCEVVELMLIVLTDVPGICSLGRHTIKTLVAPFRQARFMRDPTAKSRGLVFVGLMLKVLTFA